MTRAALLTQEQLADRSGLSVRTIRRLETRDAAARPRSGSLRLLSDALGLNSAERAALAAAAHGTAAQPSGDGSPDRHALSPSDDVPRQLPAPPLVFTGRAGELADLDRAPDAAAVVITAIDGMAGIGKTALALHAAHQLVGEYPDGQLFVDLHGHTKGLAPVEPADALERLLRALGVSGPQIPAHLEDRAALYRSRLAGRKALILLDNAASEAQVRPLLAGTPGCLVVVTSRRRLAGLDHTHTLSLDVLPLREAVALFTATVGDDRAGRGSAAELVEVVELCGRLPLAIRIAAARLKIHPTWAVEHLVARLRDCRHRLVELEAGERSVAAALDVSYEHLEPDLQRTYRAGGLHPGEELDVYAAAALTHSSATQAGRWLDQLLDAHLLHEPIPGRYGFHDLVRAHAATVAVRDDTEDARQGALTRLFDYYRHAASAAMEVAYPVERQNRPRTPPIDTPAPVPDDATQATAWLDTELPNLLAATTNVDVGGWPERTIDLSDTLHHHLRTRGCLCRDLLAPVVRLELAPPRVVRRVVAPPAGGGRAHDGVNAR